MPPLPLAIAFAALLLACTEAEPPAPPPPKIPVVEVVQRDQPILLDMVGQTRGYSDIPIRARVQGVLLGMHFREGSRVQEGDPLYSIDPVEYETKVIEGEGHVAASRTRLAKAKADLARIRPLAEMNAVSQQDLDGAVAQYEAAIGSLQASVARKKQAEIELGYTEIAAPSDGRIGISEAQVGEFVGQMPNPVVLNFVSLTDPIRVRFSIDERRYLQIARRLREAENNEEPREALELILADGTLHEHRGHTIASDAAVDPATGTFTLEADFPNPGGIILAGQFARVRATVETKKDALLVPQRAISELQGIFRVYVVDDKGEVILRAVEVGAKIDRLQIVEKGLSAGERVALDAMRLRPGMIVEPVPTTLDESGALQAAAAGA